LRYNKQFQPTKTHLPKTDHSDITPSISEKRLCLEAYPIENYIGNLQLAAAVNELAEVFYLPLYGSKM
jgi:hypothetical protein